MRLPPAYTQSCAMCGAPGTNRHEKLPRGRGGPRDEFNTVILCGSGTTGCHGFVTEHPEWARKHGWTISGQLGRDGYVGPDESYRAHYGTSKDYGDVA